jgi:hypothetical protein
MKSLANGLPDLERLTDGLTAVFSSNGSAHAGLSRIRRQPNIYASTFPSEIVRCYFKDGTKLRVMCKHQTGSNYDGHGHWGGLEYEAMVYRDVLQSSHFSAPKFYGVYSDHATDRTLLAIEYLNGAMRINKLPQPEAMGAAARWIGLFHAQSERRLAPECMPALKKYDAQYYVGWAQRTSMFAGPLHRRFPWLANVCDRFAELIAPLLISAPTIIHGEYQPHNILGRNETIYPLDWQSAAIAAGEIDLVSLTDGDWPDDLVSHCEAEYKNARWPEGAPANFEKALGAARLYWPLRWLGDLPEITIDVSSLWRFDQLRRASERLGLS